MRIIITGNPNVGKTTIFNDLTASNEKVANYCGVTTGAVSGFLFDNFGHKRCVTDLPGTYSLSAYSPEELSVYSTIVESEDNVIIHVLDATNLGKGLYFATQILDLRLPTVIVLTMNDVADGSGIGVDCAALEVELGVPVIKLSSLAKERKRQLRQIISQKMFAVSDFSQKLTNDDIESFSSRQETEFLAKMFKVAVFQDKLPDALAGGFMVDVGACRALLFQKNANWKADFIKNRYKIVENVAKKCVLSQNCAKSINLDKILLHRFIGPILVFAIFGFVLFSTFYVAEFPIRLLESLNDGVKHFISENISTKWLSGLICDGVLGGLGNVILFLPQFMLMIAFMSVLENTGYLARASFLMNRWLAFVGLSGQSFSSLVSCYACTVPGIMQSRCIRDRGERLTTLIVAPFIPCSGRVPVYLLLIALMFDGVSAFQKTVILVSVYALSTLLSLTISTVVRRFFLKRTESSYIMEMPNLAKPKVLDAIKTTLQHTILFIKKAGSLILIFSIILWLAMNVKTASNKSVVQHVGEAVEPIIKPLGYDWHIGVGLLAGLIARENLISTLGVLHSIEAASNESQSSSIRVLLKAAKNADDAPIYSFATCLSLLVFLIVSMQCIGTLVFIMKEISLKWALWQFVIVNIFAYICALSTYVIANLMHAS